VTLQPANLTDIEKTVLEVCARLGMGINSNRSEKSILKRIPPSKYNGREVLSAIKSLKSKGYLRPYRNENWCFKSNEAMKIAYLILEEKRQNIYKDLSIRAPH